MTKKKTLLRLAGGLAAFAAAALSVTAANAAGTDAGATVTNNFSVDYQVGGVSQTQITGSTDFTVDRLVDLNVAAVDLNAGTTGEVSVSPGASGEQLVFGVTNDGNDNQSYSLALEDAAGDDFDSTFVSMVYYVDAGGDGIFTPGVDDAGAGTAYTPGSGSKTSDVAPDATIWVVVTYNIPSASNGQLDGVILLADTLDPDNWVVEGASGTGGNETLAAAGANNVTGVAQNVLADATGTSASDANNDGSHSATASFFVVAASLSANKTVTVIATDGSAINCASDPSPGGNQYATPGACVEYVISVANAAGAGATATSIDVADDLPADVTFISAAQASFTGAGTLSQASGACPDPCTISLTGASLAPGVTGTLTIRATVN